MNAYDMTPRQEAIFHFMKWHLVEYQRLPTVREIAEEFKIRSPNGVVAHLQALVRHGVITRLEKGRAMNYRLNGMLLRLETVSISSFESDSTDSELSRRSAATTWTPEQENRKSLEDTELFVSQAAANACA